MHLTVLVLAVVGVAPAASVRPDETKVHGVLAASLRCSVGELLSCETMRDELGDVETSHPHSDIAQVERSDAGYRAFVYRSHRPLSAGSPDVLFVYSLSKAGEVLGRQCFPLLPSEGSSAVSAPPPDAVYEGAVSYEDHCAHRYCSSNTEFVRFALVDGKLESPVREVDSVFDRTCEFEEVAYSVPALPVIVGKVKGDVFARAGASSKSSSRLGPGDGLAKIEELVFAPRATLVFVVGGVSVRQVNESDRFVRVRLVRDEKLNAGFRALNERVQGRAHVAWSPPYARVGSELFRLDTSGRLIPACGKLAQRKMHAGGCGSSVHAVAGSRTVVLPMMCGFETFACVEEPGE